MKTGAISAIQNQNQNHSKSNVQFEKIRVTDLLQKENPELCDMILKSETLQKAAEKKNVIFDKFCTSLVVKFKKLLGTKEGAYIHPYQANEKTLAEAIRTEKQVEYIP